MTPLDRSARGWALSFARAYFGWPESRLQAIIGREGWRRMLTLWQEFGEDFYHLPEFALRQEWFHTTMISRACPNFFTDLKLSTLLLDWGCGTAEQERRAWIDRGGHTILMDVPGPNFDYLRMKYRDRAAECRPITQDLPAQYDAFMCLDVLEHISHPMEQLQALWDRLKPGGTALLWFDPSYPAAGHLPESVAQRPAYDRWLLTHTHIRYQGWVDWVEKPRRWWRLWT